MYLLFTLIEIAILIALAAIIIAAIAVLIVRLRGDSNSSGPAATGLRALQDLETKVAEVREKGSATAADCTEMRNLLATARSNGVPTLTTDSLQAKINELCPQN